MLNPVNIEDVLKFQKRWKLNLPESYREFLLKYNGGRPVPACFPIEGIENNPIGKIQVFPGLGTKIHSSDLDWKLENLGVPRPKGLLPIANTAVKFFTGTGLHAGERITVLQTISIQSLRASMTCFQNFMKAFKKMNQNLNAYCEPMILKDWSDFWTQVTLSKRRMNMDVRLLRTQLSKTGPQ